MSLDFLIIFKIFFKAFEAFVQRCPKEMTPHIGSIMDLCLNYITYDPNYNYDDADVDDSVSKIFLYRNFRFAVY